MPLLSERTETQRFVALFVGRHHTGKTVAEASFPKPSLFFDFDGNIGGAQVPWLDLKEIEYLPYPPNTPNLINILDKKIESLNNQAIVQNGMFGRLPRTVCVDSLTWMTFAFVSQSLDITHPKESQGRWIGVTRIPGPDDYKLEAQATYGLFSDLKSLPIQNLILSAHLVDTYEKPKDERGNSLPYAESIVSGYKLSIRDKIGENIQSGVNHIFHFEKESQGGAERFYVTFRGGIACSYYTWLPFGRQEWTGKDFYQFMLSHKDKVKSNAP